MGFGIVGSYNNNSLKADSELVPEDLRRDFGADAGLISGVFQSTSLSAALGTSLVLGPLYVSVLGSAGSGQQRFRYTTDQGDRSNTGVARRMNIMAMAGLVTKSFFTSLEFVQESPQFILKNITVSVTRVEALGRVGWKF